MNLYEGKDDIYASTPRNKLFLYEQTVRQIDRQQDMREREKDRKREREGFPKNTPVSFNFYLLPII